MKYTEAVQKYGSVRAAARELNIPRTTLRRHLDKERKQRQQTPPSLAAQQPRNTDALTDICESMNIKKGDVRGAWLKTEEASVFLVNQPTKSAETELSPDFIALLDSARKHVVRPSECKSGDSMLIIGLVDAHFGKLSYNKETGEDYDPQITAAIYRQAVSDSLSFFNPGRLKKIVLPIGSDMLHVDNTKSQTTAGTVVESVDTRYCRVFDIAVSATIAAVEDCLQIADVHVPVVPGNHDYLGSCLLAKVVKQYFRNDPRVTVDDNEILRKYIHWGTNLICLTHRFRKLESAAVIMATEKPKEWGMTTCREILAGHLHTSRGLSWTPYYEESGVMVRLTSSISATDLWHYENGFIGNCRAAESWLYSEETGVIGSHIAKVRS